MSDNPDQRKRERAARIELIKSIVQIGDVLTSTQCGGAIEEHIFIGWAGGHAMTGCPTPDQVRFAGSRAWTDYLAPMNVTHINRQAIDTYSYLSADYVAELRARVRRTFKLPRRAD